MAKEKRKLIGIAQKDGVLSQELLKDGWTLSFDSPITIEEAQEMLSRDHSILNDLPTGDLPKDQALCLRVYEREKARESKQADQSQSKKDEWDTLTPKEKKRQKREPIIWLIICAVLFSGSFAFVIYATPQSDKDFTYYLAIINCILMLLGAGYSISLITKMRNK